MWKEGVILEDQSEVTQMRRHICEILSTQQTWPCSAISNPAMIRNNVDLPLPEAPSKQTVSWAANEIEIPRSSG